MSAYERLEPWQQHFVDAYVEHAHAPNATAAFRLARPDISNPGEGSVRVMAKPEVRLAIEERLTRKREHSEVNEAWILSRLQLIAERCMEPLYDADGTIRRTVTDATNAVRALELLGKHFAMWTDKLAGADGGPIQVVQIVKFYDNDGRPSVTNTARV